MQPDIKQHPIYIHISRHRLFEKLRYHGRWILTKNGKNLFFAVQIEKTEINILQKKWGKKPFLLFKVEEKNYFLISLTPDGALTSSCHL